ncbi:MAG TPA: DUF349 domain-containing protein [Mycobacteriales bacterium]|nr:DUF349 domain-containing protein [Mycobacteriales bacterium]
MSEWGRVSDDGTVYVRTADGERAVGSWHAGSPEDGLAHFVRRFEQLATEVTLLEARLRSGSGDPRQVATSAERLKESLPTAAAVGDLDSLAKRVDALLEKTATAVEEHKAARAAAKEEAVARLAALAEEAEQLAKSSSWKDAGERLRNLGQDWKRVTGVEKKAADALWERVAAARKAFAERRTAHFGALEQQRTVSQERKEKLVKEAEKLVGSTDWKGTAERFKQLMTDWKTAGRAPREADDALWAQFKAAQDAFFQARSATFAEKDEELRANQKVKEEILAEAEALQVPGGKSRLRQLQDRWDAAGKVPREVMRSLEDRFGKVEEKFRGTADTAHVKTTESTFVVRLREKVADLEKKLAQAREQGRSTGDLEAQLETQRGWLAQAGVPVDAPVAPPAPAAAPAKKPTTAWVRAEPGAADEDAAED